MTSVPYYAYSPIQDIANRQKILMTSNVLLPTSTNSSLPYMTNTSSNTHNTNNTNNPSKSYKEIITTTLPDNSNVSSEKLFNSNACEFYPNTEQHDTSANTHYNAYIEQQIAEYNKNREYLQQQQQEMYAAYTQAQNYYDYITEYKKEIDKQRSELDKLKEEVAHYKSIVEMYNTMVLSPSNYTYMMNMAMMNSLYTTYQMQYKMQPQEQMQSQTPTHVSE